MAPDAAGTTASPPMAPGLGGFNIDPPAAELPDFEGDVAVKELRRQMSLHPDFALAPPVQVQRNQAVPWLGRLLLVLISAVGAFGLAFVTLSGGDPSQTRKQDKAALVPAAPPVDIVARPAPLPPARLVVESQRAYANEPAPLGVALNGGSGGEMLTLVGLAAGTKLSAGTPRGASTWQVSAHELTGAFAYAPKDFIGVMDAAVDLRSASDRLVDSQVVRLEWIQRKPDVRAALEKPDVRAALASRREREPAAPAPIVALDPEEVATLLKRGQDFLKTGDIASARLVLRRAANAGSAPAALALGATFDQAVLTELGVLGFAADEAEARAWYQRAHELGSAEASRRLDRLAGTVR